MGLSKQEGVFKRKLKEKLEKELPDFFIQTHADMANGTPDWSVNGNGITSWLEFKHATPSFYSRGVQVMTARKLAATSKSCKYVVFWEDSAGRKMTYIVMPSDVLFGRNPVVNPCGSAEGHDLDFVIRYIEGVHGL